ncbi:MAG: penicillin-binding protein 1C [Pseudomonadota bacterium]
MKRTLKRLLGGAAVLFGLWWFCPQPSLYGTTPFSVAVVDRNGELLRLALASDERYRLRVPLDEISTTAIDATLLYEDRHFFTHPGVNPAALIRAAWTTYVRRQRPVGGSTISMQLARLRFGLTTRSPSGKFKQVLRALQLERHYSKAEILEAYLNLAPYGGNVEGIGTAARIYFGKAARELTLTEALALAVVPQNPVARNPQRATGVAAMRAASQRLFETWRTRYTVTDTQVARFAMTPVIGGLDKLPFLAPHGVQRALAEAPATERLVLSLDGQWQRRLEQRIDWFVDHHRDQGIDNAAAMLVDSRTMEVLAEVGSAGFFNAAIEGQVNGTRAKRSPGSTLKPFVYALALDDGLIHPMTLLKDAPYRFADYTPENFDRGFVGPILARDALIYSRNVPAIHLLQQVGLDRLHQLLLDGGVNRLRSAAHYGLAAVLGGNELTMAELVRLYAMLANGGVDRSLRYRTDQPMTVGPRLLSGEASFLTLAMLAENPRPLGAAVPLTDDHKMIAWKTGTSYAFRDAWSIGVVGPYVVAVWVGHFDGHSNHALVGRRAAAPLFFDIVNDLLVHRRDARRQLAHDPALNVTKIDVCEPTGDLPGKHCPRATPGWFIPGVSPIKVSNVHRAVKIDSRSGRRSCGHSSGPTDEVVFEFWPSDIAQLFRQAGFAVATPPPWDEACPLTVRAATGRAPEITSPQNRLTVYRRPGSADDGITLEASTDADAEALFWFANDRFIAKTARNTAHLWSPPSGRYRLVVVDDLGRSDGIDIDVADAPLAAR